MNRRYAICCLAVLIVIATVSRLASCHDADGRSFRRAEGSAFHTIYHLTYASDVDLHDSVRALLRDVDFSLSMFNERSVVARMNAGDTSARADSHFRHVFDRATDISALTDGAFDITVAPLVNLWGFGFKNREHVTDRAVDSLLRYVGWQTVSLDSAGFLHKAHAETVLDASSIAKGYAVDVVAALMRRHGVDNYMIEIGGEIALSGHNPRGTQWAVGINSPTDDSTQQNHDLQAIAHLTDCSLATSGNYRNFYYDGNRRYAHTIDPHTGRPVQQDVLSATVIAPDCTTADALATAFMVMGSERAMRIAEADTTLMVYLIVADEPADAGRADTGGGAHSDASPYRIVCSPRLLPMLSQP